MKPVSSFEVTPTVGAYVFAPGQGVNATPLYGLRVGYNIVGTTMADSLGVEGNVNYFSSTAKGGGKADGLVFGTDAIYSFYPRKAVVPFLAIGVGGLLIDKDKKQDNSPYFDYGFGVKYFLKNWLALRMDARHLLIYNSVATRNNFEVTAGLSFAFSDLVRVIPKATFKPKPLNPNLKAVPDIKDGDQLQDNPAQPAAPAPAAPPAAAPEAQPEARPDQQEYDKAAEENAKALAIYEAEHPEEAGKALIVLGAVQPVEEAAPAAEPAPAAAPDSAPASAPAAAEQAQPAPAAEKAAPSQAPAPAAAASPAHRNVAVTVEFDFNSATVRPEYLGKIKELAELIKTSPELAAQVEGHTDFVGKGEPNLRLSLMRAENVKKLLVKYGAKPEKVTTKGFGFTKPKAVNRTSQGRQRNRRADAFTREGGSAPKQ